MRLPERKHTGNLQEDFRTQTPSLLSNKLRIPKLEGDRTSEQLLLGEEVPDPSSRLVAKDEALSLDESTKLLGMDGPEKEETISTEREIRSTVVEQIASLSEVRKSVLSEMNLNSCDNSTVCLENEYSSGRTNLLKKNSYNLDENLWSLEGPECLEGALGDVEGAPLYVEGAPLYVEGAPLYVEGAPLYVEGAPRDVEGAPRDVEGAPRDVEGAPRDVEGAPRDVEGAPRDVEGAPRDVEGAPRDVEGAPRDVEGAPRDVEGAPRDVEGAPRDVEGAPRDVEGAPRDVEGAHRDVEGAPRDVEGAPRDVEGAPRDVEGAPRDVEGAPRDVEGAPRDVEGAPRDVEGAPRDVEGAPRDVEGAPRDVEGAPRDVEGAPRDVEGAPRDVEGAPRDVEGAPRDVEGAPRDVEGAPRDVEGAPRDVEGAPRDVEGAPRDVEGADRDVEGAPCDVEGAPLYVEVFNSEENPISSHQNPDVSSWTPLAPLDLGTTLVPGDVEGMKGRETNSPANQGELNAFKGLKDRNEGLVSKDIVASDFVQPNSSESMIISTSNIHQQIAQRKSKIADKLLKFKREELEVDSRMDNTNSGLLWNQISENDYMIRQTISDGQENSMWLGFSQTPGEFDIRSAKVDDGKINPDLFEGYFALPEEGSSNDAVGNIVMMCSAPEEVRLEHNHALTGGKCVQELRDLIDKGGIVNPGDSLVYVPSGDIALPQKPEGCKPCAVRLHAMPVETATAKHKLETNILELEEQLELHSFSGLEPRQLLQLNQEMNKLEDEYEMMVNKYLFF